MTVRSIVRPGWALSLLLLAATSCSTGTRSGDGSWIELFNGKDLRGWVAIPDASATGPGSTWSVRDDVIVCQGEPLGFLHTERSFTDFRLEVEYRWAPGQTPGNSGVFSRIDGQPRALPRCVEVQLMHGNAGDVLGLQGRTIAAGQERHFHVAAHPLAGDIDGVRKTRDAEAAPGSWNHLAILAQGSTYTVWLNGVELNRATGVEVLPGPVGLQSEGGEIHFRHPRIQPL